MNLDRRKHAGFEAAAAIRKDVPHLVGAGLRIDVRIDIEHAARQEFARIGVERHGRRSAHAHERKIALGDGRFDPHDGEIRDAVQRLAGHDVRPLEGLFVKHHSTGRRSEGHDGLRLPALFERLQVLRGQVPEREATPRRSDESVGALTGFGELRLLHLVPRLHGQQVFAFRRQDLGTVQREQGLTFRHRLSGDVDEQIADPPFDLEIHVGQTTLVITHDARRADRLGAGRSRHRHGPDAEQLLPSWIDRQIAGRLLRRRRAAGCGGGTYAISPRQRQRESRRGYHRNDEAAHYFTSAGATGLTAVGASSAPTARSRSAKAWSCSLRAR